MLRDMFLYVAHVARTYNQPLKPFHEIPQLNWLCQFLARITQYVFMGLSLFDVAMKWLAFLAHSSETKKRLV